MSSGERPIGAAKGKQPNTEALCQPSPPPITVHYYTCDFCDAHVDSPWAHAAHSCPVFQLCSHWVFVCLLTTTPKQAGAYLPDGTFVVLPASGAALAVALETNLPASRVATGCVRCA